MKRGDIYYVTRKDVTGHEQQAGRPAIIVSNNNSIENAGVVEVVFLTTQPKREMHTHVQITSSRVVSTALCEQITTVSVERLGDYYGECTADEMKKVNNAMRFALDLKEDTLPIHAFNAGDNASRNDSDEMAQVKFERDTYKKMYDELLGRVIRR